MRKNQLVIAIVVCTIAGGAGCDGPSGSCTSSGTPVCVDLLAGFDDAGGYCASFGFSYSEARCPSSGRVARCTLSGVDDAGNPITYRNNFYAPYTSLDVRQQCPPATPVAGVTYEFEEN